MPMRLVGCDPLQCSQALMRRELRLRKAGQAVPQSPHQMLCYVVHVSPDGRKCYVGKATQLGRRGRRQVWEGTEQVGAQLLPGASVAASGEGHEGVQRGRGGGLGRCSHAAVPMACQARRATRP
jgi:hypothetical protein